MTDLTVNGVRYGVDVRHFIGRRLNRLQRRPVDPIGHDRLRAITACVIARWDSAAPTLSPMVSQGVSCCVPEDTFNRRTGLRQAFQMAAHGCRDPRWDTAGLMTALDARWPVRTPPRPTPGRPAVKLSEHEVQLRKSTLPAVTTRATRDAKRAAKAKGEPV